MVALCFYFEVHQPFRINHYRIKDIGEHKNYFNSDSNQVIFEKVAKKCYWPAGLLIASLLKRYPTSFKVTFSLSGTFLAQCEEYDPKLLELYQDILSLKNAEIICETSHHSLSALIDEEEFFAQIDLHKKNIKKLFDREVSAFRNTELIYSNNIGKLIEKAGFNTCLVEGWDPFIPQGWNPHHVFHHPEKQNLKLLPKSYKLSDDLAFRFSNRGWESWPLTPEKYHAWFEKLLDGTHEFVGLFMDYETFGEHQWADTGIFEFLENFISNMTLDKRFEFLTVSEVSQKFSAQAPLDIDRPLSWADTERDISAWLGNRIQEDAFAKVYSLKKQISSLKDDSLTEEWRRLLTSDHFYYMCIKWSNDGDVHKYFSPFESPYEAYLDYVNILEDFELKCAEKIKEKELTKNNVLIQAYGHIGENAACPKTIQASSPQPISSPVLVKMDN
ncbi:glycoside hydrolase family 57 protein [Fluviispira vulneris]|uniref:glycoside hydrolase family 57 protein n=1 Tax=Fluviispira vulneris TaxID=2763012 RepID=UPI0016484C0C|nr:glycoside hydrolase family 57 protein [Fluviispira vulneris]